MPDLARLRSDLAAFAAAVGQPLTAWQAAALKLRRRTTVIVAPGNRARVAASASPRCIKPSATPARVS
jgi:hypothetical protein